MIKKIFSFFIFSVLSILSFYGTTLAIDYIKSLDPIMIDIENNKMLYEVEAVNAQIDAINIIPGISGVGIDIDSSYKMMKKYGKYSDQLLVFNAVKPVISLENVYDKYITRGNTNFSNVALIFKITNTNYLEEIIYLLKEKEVTGTFFIEDEVLKNNRDIVKLLFLNNQKIESLGSNGRYISLNIDSTNRFLKSYINQKLSYCYTDTINNNTLNICSNEKLHTIIPTINTSKFPYFEMKQKLENGAIIKLDNTDQVVNELKHIINYIRQNNYKIVSLEKLLEE